MEYQDKPSTSLSLLQEVREKLQSGLFKEAEIHCRKILAQNAAPLEAASSLLALCLIQQEEKEEGLHILEQIERIEDLPDSASLTDAGGCYLILNQLEQTITLLKKAISLDCNNWLAHSRLGIALALRGRFFESCQEFEQALTIAPERSEITINLARVLIHLNRPEEALTNLDSLQQKVPWSTLIRNIRVEALVSLNRLEEAEKIAQTIDSQNLTNPRYLHLLSLIAAGQDRHEDTEFYLRKALDLNPTDVRIQQKLSELALIQGRFLEATHILEQVTETEPDNPALWIQLSKAYLQSNMIKKAENAALKSLELTKEENDPARAPALSALASAAVERSDPAKGLSLFHDALSLQPDSTPALFGLGHLHMQLGEIDKAINCFEKLSTIAPMISQTAMINARRFPDNPAILKKIEDAATSPSLAGSVNSNLLFILAKSWEQREDYHQAFTFAEQANKACRKFISYDSEQNEQFTDRNITQYSQNFFAKRRDFGCDSRLPIFILGMPRSGTTLVEQILSSHPQIHGAGELGHIPAWCRGLALYEKYVSSGLEYPECMEGLTADEAGRIVKKCLLYLRSFSSAASHVTDKLPHNFVNIGFIHLLFPNAPIINCVRDSRDIAISNFFMDYHAKFHGMGFAYDLKDLGHHINDYRRFMRHWHTLLPGRIFDIHYEDLIEEPEKNVRLLLDHIQVEWDNRVLNFHTSKRQVKTASLWQVRQPIYTKSKHRWKKYHNHLKPLLKIMQYP